MVVRGVVATTYIARIIKAIDARKMVKLQYEATTNLSLLATFVAFATILSHPTISKE
jgi:hypothetical protein